MDRRRCLLGLAALAAAPVRAEPALLDGAALVAQARFRYFGFEVYDIRLWAREGFDFDRFERHPFVLELAYLRALKGEAIAQRSIDEMKGLQPVDDNQAGRWLAAMRQAFPDVQRGDRLAGLNRPGEGAQFAYNGRPTAEVTDTEFARLFFGIWLAPGTSAPRLREALRADWRSRRP